jgi:hypothetical protein
MTTLIDNISSDYLEGYASLLPKNYPKPVVVYVESDLDIAFWRMILHPYETSEIRFEVKLPSNDSLVKNKQKALSRSDDLLRLTGIGKFLLICVDSDYDYLLQSHYIPEDKKSISKKINESIYIFQTYSYSIENLNCFSKSLYNICVATTYNDTYKINFVEFFKLLSKSVYKLFLWNLIFYSKGEEEKFTLSEFCKLIIFEYNNSIPQDTIMLSKMLLENLNSKITSKLKQLEHGFPSYLKEIEQLGKDLKERGLTEDTAYLYIQGHTIFDNVVWMLLKPICNQLKKEKVSEIKRLAKDSNDKLNSLEAYLKKIGKLDDRLKTILSNNMDFKSCFLFQKIESDIKKYIQELKS